VSRDRLGLLLACLATLAVVLPLGYLWQQSRVPSSYSVMDMGYLDYGGGERTGHHHMEAGRSVEALTVGTDRPADRVVELATRKGRVKLASGRTIDGYTLNGTSPGPTIEATAGELVEVRLTNVDVPDGVTLHWHGLDVPNAEDGVAGVTQDAVRPGDEHTYRFVAHQVGTFWYHSHQVSHAQVIRGLLGALVVRPRTPDRAVVDVSALSHTYSGTQTVNGLERDIPVEAKRGQRVRVRVVNSDNGPMRTWVGAPYRVVAVDGTDVHEPTRVEGRSLVVTAGGRADLEVVAPQDGTAVRVQVGGTIAMVVGPAGAAAPPAPQPAKELDLLSYGSPAPLGLDPAKATRHFSYEIGRRPGFVKGKPGVWWTVNGHLYPNLPMFVVKKGDVVRVRIENNSGEVHPMHLHGHHAVVLSRNGRPATGSPWWFDSLNVEDGESFEVAFLADNPGIWMDHCHNLKHARQGLVTHLMYAGVSDPYRVGGAPGNEPE
jgi:FtsP/CotA-like multicopper oxidase with cupredoxin domain